MIFQSKTYWCYPLGDTGRASIQCYTEFVTPNTTTSAVSGGGRAGKAEGGAGERRAGPGDPSPHKCQREGRPHAVAVSHSQAESQCPRSPSPGPAMTPPAHPPSSQLHSWRPSRPWSPPQHPTPASQPPPLPSPLHPPIPGALHRRPCAAPQPRTFAAQAATFGAQAPAFAAHAHTVGAQARAFGARWRLLACRVITRSHFSGGRFICLCFCLASHSRLVGVSCWVGPFTVLCLGARVWCLG